MMKKLLALFIACLMITGMLAACNSGSGGGTDTQPPAGDDGGQKDTESAGQGDDGQTSGETIEIRLLTRMAGTSKQVEIFKEILDEFQTLHPEVVIVDDSQGDDASFNNILKTDMSSGTMANIFRIQGVANLAKYIEEGYILDVEPYIEADPEWGQFAEGALNYYRVPGVDGIYAVPCEGGLIGVYYNERLFKEAGIDEFPETWNAFKDAIEKLKASGVTPLALGAKTSYMAGHLHNQIFYKWMGTEAAKKLGNRELAWTDEGVVETLGFVKELFDMGAMTDGVAGISDDLVKADFQNGDAAMMITGPWNIPSFTDPEQCPEYEHIKLAKFPYFEEKPEFKDEDMQVISPYMINGKLEGRELELTIELVKMLTNKENAERFANETSQLIPRTDLEVDQSMVDPLFNDNIDFCATSTGVAVDVFDYDPLASMQDRTRNSIVSMFTGSTAEEAAKEIQAEVDKGE